VRLAQVFANLLNNASKYSPEGNEIALAAEGVGSEAMITSNIWGKTSAGMPIPTPFKSGIGRITTASRPFVAAVTGFGQPEDRRRTREAGFDHHLVKPFGPASFKSVPKI
jgi:hypothetical protein